MTDVLTDEQRRYCMSRIKNKNTKPEMMVRKLVYALGYRYRLHVKKLPGSPDLVFPGKKKVIFVHGCFWHRHNCSYGRVVPQTRKQFWAEKLEKNKQRDRDNLAALKKIGWDVLTIWECETKNPKEIDKLIDKIKGFLNNKRAY